MSPSIFLRVIQTLDRHQVATDSKLHVLQLGRSEQKELDEYLVGNMLDRAYGRPTAATPTFDGIVIELVDTEHCLSVARL